MALDYFEVFSLRCGGAVQLVLAGNHKDAVRRAAHECSRYREVPLVFATRRRGEGHGDWQWFWAYRQPRKQFSAHPITKAEVDPFVIQCFNTLTGLSLVE